MDLEKLKSILKRRNVDCSSYEINGNVRNKTYFILKDQEKWEVFYYDENQKSKFKVFYKENEAATYLYDLLLKDPKTRNKIKILNLIKLEEKLNSIGVKNSAYVLGKYGEEKFCILKNDESKWEVFASDRGNKNELQLFDSESDACEYFYNYITGYDFIRNDLKL